MPHSSGGGSSGGGSHGGSGGSGAPATRTSSRPFPGAHCYVYYDRFGNGRTLYTNADPKTARKQSITSLIVLGIATLVPAAVIPMAGFHNPHKIDTGYSSTLRIEDGLDVLTQAEEDGLKDTFRLFYERSGVTPAFVSIHNDLWKGHYSSLEGYAYDKYLSMFQDESHWLLVYAADDGNKTNWAFEGMQGNDTDPALTVRTTTTFNQEAVNYLNGTYSVGESFLHAFASVGDTMMESYFEVDRGVWIFCAIWEAITLTLFVTTLVKTIQEAPLKTAKRFDGEIITRKCPYCGHEYFQGTVDRCPSCQAPVPLHDE
ncbi:MAG: hypothetical protein K6E59_05305 [Bacilli bacterium]|nr:hypothetical protein [Bacilli bacterium]